MTTNILQELPDTLGRCLTLRKLMVGGNHLTRLPYTFGYLTNLRELQVRGGSNPTLNPNPKPRPKPNPNPSRNPNPHPGRTWEMIGWSPPIQAAVHLTCLCKLHEG